MPKKTLLVCAVAALVLAGGVFGYRLYQARQPASSLARLVEACQKRDVVRFRRYIALDAIVANAVNNLKQKVLPGKIPSGSNEMEQLGAAIGEGVLQMIVPNVSREVVAGVEQAVAAGKLDYLRLCRPGLFGAADAAPCHFSVNSVTKKDKRATVSATLTDATGQRSVPLVLEMEPRDNHWQIVAVDNLQDLLVSAPYLLKN
jgi:hypothetical protein